jgi:hypothetical protein
MMNTSLYQRLVTYISNKKNKYRIFWFLLLIAFVARLFICFGINLSHTIVDSDEYFLQADKLLEGSYINYFPNGYPYIIAVAKLISSNHAAELLLCLNIVLGTCSVYFVYTITQKVFSDPVLALLAACLMAIFPTQINYTRWLLTEVPSTFLLLGFYSFYLQKRFFTAGLAGGLAVIIRTELLAIFLLVFIAELLMKKSFRFMLAAGLLVPMLAAGYYAFVKTGSFSLSGHSKANIMYSITSSGGYVDWYFQDKHPEVKTSGQAMELYIEYLKNDPGTYIKNRFANLWELWGFFPSSSDGGRSFISRILIGGINLFLLLFGCCGFFKNYRRFDVLILIFPFLVVTGVHTLLLALPRYTFTAEPFLLILASFCCLSLLKKFVIKNQTL